MFAVYRPISSLAKLQLYLMLTHSAYYMTTSISQFHIFALRDWLDDTFKTMSACELESSEETSVKIEAPDNCTVTTAFADDVQLLIIELDNTFHMSYAADGLGGPRELADTKQFTHTTTSFTDALLPGSIQLSLTSLP